MKNYVFISSGYRGGATKFIEQHINYLKKQKIKAITLIDDNPYKTYTGFNFNGITIIQLPINNNYFYSNNKLKIFFKNKNNLNIFITNFAIYIKYFFLLSYLQKNNAKILLTIHSGLLNFTFKNFIAAFLFSFLSKKIDFLYFGSSSARDWWFSNFPWFFNKKYKITYNGIDIPKKLFLLKKGKRLNVSFVGRFESENNPELFLRLAKESFLAGGIFDFHMFGDGSLLSSLKKEYSSYAQFYNWRSLEEIYKITNVLVITSTVNNFPYVALEAKSYGVPVLSCSKGDISKIIKNNKDGYLISSSDPRTLLEYLNKIKKNFHFLIKNSLKNRHAFNINNACNKFWHSVL
jgi:glycosyltransferase involved in cell wall biosynthesis